MPKRVSLPQKISVRYNNVHILIFEKLIEKRKYAAENIRNVVKELITIDKNMKIIKDLD